MFIICTRSTFVAGAVIESGPTPIDVSDAAGLQLIQLGKAIAAPVSVETPAESPAEKHVVSVPAPVEEKSKAKAKGNK